MQLECEGGKKHLIDFKRYMQKDLMRNECEQRPIEWLRISPRFQTWMIRRMVSFTKRRHTLGEKG